TDREKGEDTRKLASILWGYGGTVMLPHGRFPVLSALTKGYLCRRPHAAARVDRERVVAEAAFPVNPMDAGEGLAEAEPGHGHRLGAVGQVAGDVFHRHGLVTVIDLFEAASRGGRPTSSRSTPLA